MTRARWLSPTMLRALRELRDHSDPRYSAYGMSERGGRAATVGALERRGLIEGPWGEWRITEAGLDALDILGNAKENA